MYLFIEGLPPHRGYGLARVNNEIKMSFSFFPFFSFLFRCLLSLTHTPYITAVEAGRSSRRDEGPGLDLGGVFLTKKDPPFFMENRPQNGV